MSRIRLNQEYRNKIGNRLRVHAEQEDTIEKQKKNTERNKMLMMLGKYGKKLKV